MDQIHSPSGTHNPERQIGLGGLLPQAEPTTSFTNAAAPARHTVQPENGEPPPVITGEKRQLV